MRLENDELRHQVSAQTSMLTSRNREKDRLYHEIEELKLQLRGGNPTPSMSYDRSESRAQSVSDRILDRSVSRAGAGLLRILGADTIKLIAKPKVLRIDSLAARSFGRKQIAENGERHDEENVGFSGVKFFFFVALC